jgi:uncharacterized protein
MLVDSNTYVGHWPFKHLKYNTCEAVLGRMNQYGVDAAVLSNLNGIFYKNTQPANVALMEEIRSKKAFQDRFIPFAVINPIFGGWKDDFNTCADKLGMKGIRLYPQYHGYELSNPYLVELVKRARDRGLPVAFSLRMVDSRPSSWLDITQEWSLKDLVPIVRQVPDARYLVLNVANSTQLNEEDLQLFRSADLILDTSGRNMSNLGELLQKFGKTKFAFGTHSPILDYLTGLLRVEALTSQEADEPTRELLRGGNIQRFLKG